MEAKSPHVTRTALFYAAGIALYCTRMFTRSSENATDRLNTTVNQVGLLFDSLAEALDSGAEEPKAK